jgi:preprotein translocase subunit SecG
MYTFLTILIIIVSALLGIVVLVQNSKGGGLSAGLSSSNQVMGVKKTSDLIEKMTWGLAITLIVLCLATNIAIPRGGAEQGNSKMKEQIDNAPAPAQPQQQAPAKTAPAQQTAPAGTPAPQHKK